MMDHGGARARRTNDEFGVALFAQIDKTLGYSARLGAIAGIKSRLATTGLSFIEFNFAAGPAQDFDGADADAAPQLIYQAGNEQAHLDRPRTTICGLRIALNHKSNWQYSDQSAIGNRKSTIPSESDHALDVTRRVNVI